MQASRRGRYHFTALSMNSSLSKSDILHYVNGFYSNIVHAQYSASCLTIPCKRHNFYKHWWDEELSLLKEKAIASFRLWSALGKPRTGSEYDTMRQYKLTYKLTLRNKESDSKDQFSDSLNDALMCKDINRFWQTWRSKFGRKPRSMIIDGFCEEKSIADRFASVFQSVCTPNTDDRHRQLLT